MIQFRFGHNKALAAAAAAMSSSGFSGAGLLSDFASHVDPTPLQLRAEKRKAYAWTEEEIEAFNSGVFPCKFLERFSIETCVIHHPWLWWIFDRELRNVRWDRRFDRLGLSSEGSEQWAAKQ